VRALFLTILDLAISVCADSSGSDTHIYRGTESVSQIGSEEESLLVSVSDCICMRNNEMLYDYGTLNKASELTL